MFALFMILFLVSLLAMIIGIIKPSVFSKMFKGNVSRKKLFFVFGLTTLTFFIIAIATTPKNLQVESTQQNKSVVKEENREEPKQETKSEPQVESVKIEEQEPTPETVEQKITKAINNAIGDKTNTNKARVVEVSMHQYNVAELKAYNYKSTDKVFNAFIKINSSENLTTDLQKGTLNDEATKIFQNVFPIQSDIVDITLWSQLPLKDQYGNIKDDVAVIYGMARPLFDKMNWSNFNHRDLPQLLKSEGRTDDRNSYFEKIKF